MYEEMQVRVEGVAPLIMHNGRLANPMDPVVREIARISAKERKTEVGAKKQSDLQWFGALYLNEENEVIVPGENIEAMLVLAGRKFKKGQQVTSGVFCDGAWKLEMRPKLKQQAFTIGSIQGFIPTEKRDVEFRDQRMGRVPPRTGGRVVITRPIFRNWSLAFTLSFEPTIIDREMLIEIVRKAGREIGLLDWRPKFGRFELMEYELMEKARRSSPSDVTCYDE